MLELITTIALALSCGTRVPNTIPSPDSEFLHTRSISSLGDYEETTSFGNAEALSFNDPNRMAEFERRNDVDYYKYQITTSGYYKFGVSCTKTVHTMVYTKSSSELSPQLYTEYNENYGDSNFGFDNGIYIDSTQTQWLYFKINPVNGTNALFYIPIIKYFTPHNTGENELIKYDVDTKLFNFEIFNDTSYTTTTTIAYNPFGTASFYIPQSYQSENEVVLQDTSLVDPNDPYPYSTIGRNNGTAYLIGQNLAMTAAKMLMFNGVLDLNAISQGITFGNIGNISSINANYQSIYFNVKALFPSNDNDLNQNDWAVCILDDYYGLDLGYLQIKRNATNYNTLKKLAICGYNYDSINNNSSMSLFFGNFYNYDVNLIKCCTFAGESAFGAPILDVSNGYVVGTNNGIMIHQYLQSQFGNVGSLFTNELFCFIEHLRDIYDLNS